MLCSFVSNEQIKQDFFAILLIEYMYIYDKIVRTRLVTHTHMWHSRGNSSLAPPSDHYVQMHSLSLK